MTEPPPWIGRPEAEHITRIRVLFAQGLPDRVGRMRSAATALAQGEEEEAGLAARELFLEAHRLAGSAESFGGERIGGIAFRIDHLLRKHHDAGTLPPADVVRALPPLIGELEEAEREFLQWMRWGDSS